MKKISVILQTYNEVENVVPIYEEILKIFKNKLNQYNYEILFTDNHSEDGTIDKIKAICKNDKNVKAIINAKNFQGGSGTNALCNVSGDCVILMASDFQDPPDCIYRFVKEWEKGYKIVIGIKKKSETSKLMHFIRGCYYKLMNEITSVEQIEHFTGFGLYDREFLEIINANSGPLPYIRGFVAKYGYKIKKINFVQPKRKSGISSNKLLSLYDIAMRGITTYSKTPVRFMEMLGLIICFLAFFIGIVGIILLCLNIIFINPYIFFLLIFIIFFQGICLFFVGILGEYILCINIRTMKQPIVIEEERINF